MKRLFLPVKGAQRPLASAWMVVMKLGCVTLLFGSFGHPTRARGHTPGTMEATASPVSTCWTSDTRAYSAPLFSKISESEAAVDALENPATTHTVRLPLIAAGPRQPSGPPFGVQWLNIGEPGVEPTAQLGARWMRVPFLWGLVEPVNTTPENYQWYPVYDHKLAELSARGIKAILTLMWNPSWAATYAGGPIDRVELDELVEFMQAAVNRYGKPPYNVKHWEFYNEPDNGNPLFGERGWGYFGYQPEAYVELLAAVYQPMKDVDPEAEIVMGGIAYDAWTETGGPFVEAFLDGVLANNGAAYFDVMNFHYYPAFQQIWDPYGRGIIGKTAYLRRKLAAYGAYKPFICTETGTESDAAHGGSDELQSRYVVQAFTRTLVAGLDTTIWFTLIDESGIGIRHYGLLDPSLNPNPSFTAYQTVVQQLSTSRYVRTLSGSETGSGQIEAYAFDAAGGSTRTIVAWSNDQLFHILGIEAEQLVMADKFGAETIIYDDDDGVRDGRVHASVGPSPVYLRLAR